MFRLLAAISIDLLVNSFTHHKTKSQIEEVWWEDMPYVLLLKMANDFEEYQMYPII